MDDKALVLQALLRAGATAAGVCRFAEVLPLLPCRAAARLPETPASILVGLFPYYTGEHEGRNLARYAIVDDYHTVVRALLERAAAELRGRFPGRAFEPFVDSSPIREVAAAHRAGLGFVGKNGLLVAPEYGSYLFIGELVTDLPLPADAEPPASRCGDCRRCLEACPGGAIRADGSVEPARCRSHITQKKGELNGWERESVRAGGLVWGCDLCTDCCPWNRAARHTPVEAFTTGIRARVDRETVRALCKTRAFGFRGPGVLERNLSILERDPDEPS